MPSQCTPRHQPWSIITPNQSPVLKNFVMDVLQQRISNNKIFLKLSQISMPKSAKKKIPKGTYFRIQVFLFKVDQPDKSISSWQSHS
jgi:hypothetical protein